MRFSGNELQSEMLLFQESKGVKKQNAGAGFATFYTRAEKYKKKMYSACSLSGINYAESI